jgi:hypothetical protein
MGTFQAFSARSETHNHQPSGFSVEAFTVSQIRFKPSIAARREGGILSPQDFVPVELALWIKPSAAR